ncbi:hypothetical protein T265_03773 [Opisthorchis viverrini]|uniref:Uncharacterized protein n=1 Tax=Opisthorchis viverrini TaxID=6198 RepID=A0A074ZQL2_OPIVI|nr:hypothetical protein T265_03773 [Opisthorchis viverrini]KER29668.1 hypothetical protein T265_03773 [Opisthorchis viverrini]
MKEPRRNRLDVRPDSISVKPDPKSAIALSNHSGTTMASSYRIYKWIATRTGNGAAGEKVAAQIGEEVPTSTVGTDDHVRLRVNRHRQPKASDNRSTTDLFCYFEASCPGSHSLGIGVCRIGVEHWCYAADEAEICASYE